MTTTSPPRLIDVDCNLLHKDLKSLLLGNDNDGTNNGFDLLQEDAVQESNICAMLSPSSTIDEAQRGIQLLLQKQQESPAPRIQIKTTVGVHPYHVLEQGPPTREQMEQIKTLLVEHKDVCVAVGECGLDASKGFPPLEQQVPWFRAQVQLAQELELPLFVHERLAFDQTMEILQDITTPVLIHCFTGTRQECKAYIEQGYYISLSGMVCRKDAGREIRQCLEEGLLPLNRIMVETDAPYMGFEGGRQLYLEKNAERVLELNSKKRKKLQRGLYPNVPSSLPAVVDQVWKSMNLGRKDEEPWSRDHVADNLTQNAIRLFGFDLN